MPSVSRRKGVGLGELLVALALASVVVAAASRTVILQGRLHRERDAQSQADQVVRDVHDVLRAALAHAAADLRVLGDTGVEMASARIAASACELSAGRLVIPASQPWWSPPRAGDSLAVIDTLTRLEWRAEIAATGTQRASVSCPTGGTRLTLVVTPPASAPVLALPVRVWRRVRYVAYRAGDGKWWLGERSCAPACGAAQPIAGPFLPPAQGGMRLTLVPFEDGSAKALDVSVRALIGGRHSELSARIPVAAAP